MQFGSLRPRQPRALVREDSVVFWTSGLAYALGRFEGSYHKFNRIPLGGVGCFTFDNFPIFDYAPRIPNVYVIADSNHGFKMVGVGKEVAKVLDGGRSSVLEPFCFARFAGRVIYIRSRVVRGRGGSNGKTVTEDGRR